MGVGNWGGGEDINRSSMANHVKFAINRNPSSNGPDPEFLIGGGGGPPLKRPLDLPCLLFFYCQGSVKFEGPKLTQKKKLR